jgi:hypothetical protein
MIRATAVNASATSCSKTPADVVPKAAYTNIGAMVLMYIKIHQIRLK